ncbi:MAG: HAMP domain-containing histidine kinase [Anaerolineae bacterium]|nr:HAMP domain-containing histidine kinase [Anaerolineae bacterium]
MNRLWVRLTLSHAALVLLGILLVAFLTGQALELTLRREAARQALEGTDLVARLEEWNRAQGRGMGMGWMHRMSPGAPRVILADRNGLVVYDWQGEPGRYLTALERRLAVRLTDGGEFAGYVLPLSVSALSQEYAVVLQVMRRTMLIAAGVAALGALLASLLVSESLSAPLRRLVAGARAVAAGKLEHRIEAGGPDEARELAHAFNHMAASLQDAERRRRELTADIAHELRTPLTVLQGNLSAMLDGVYAPSEEEVAALYDQVLRLNRLVHDLGQLAEFDSGRMSLELAPVDLAESLESSLTIFRPAMEARGITLVGDWPSHLPPVLADGSRVGQVLANLLSNALRHTPEGGTVRVEAKPADDALEVSVSDTGEGISEAELPHIFDRLWRAEHSRSREHGGSGLGLAIARQLVEAMHGSIGVTSSLGQGSRFWFRLPVAAVPSASLAAPPAPQR